MVTVGPMHETMGLISCWDMRVSSRGGSGPPLSPEPLFQPGRWELGVVAAVELQSYHEGVRLGAELVGEPVDGEGHIRHHVEVVALHGVLQNSSDAAPREPSWWGGHPRALPAPFPILILTSPSTGVAPIYFCNTLMSLVGPVMSDVPVSTMAWQPFVQKATVPASWMLDEEEREKEQEGFVLSPRPRPTLLSLPSTTHLSSWICQYPCWVTGTQFRVPMKREGSKPPKSSSPPSEDSGFLEGGGDMRDFRSFTSHLNGWIYIHALPTNA